MTKLLKVDDCQTCMGSQNNAQLNLFDLLKGHNQEVVVELLDETAVEGTLAHRESQNSSILLLKNALIYNRRIKTAKSIRVDDCYIRCSRIRFIHFKRFIQIFDHFKSSMKRIGNLFIYMVFQAFLARF